MRRRDRLEVGVVVTTRGDVAWLAGVAGSGCPVRRRFRSVLVTPEVVVARARYGGEDASAEVFRACLRATRRDPVIAEADASAGFGAHVRVLGATGRWVLLATTPYSRYTSCEDTVVSAVGADFPYPGGRLALPCSTRIEEAVATPGGGVAARVRDLAAREPADAIVAISPGGALRVLDRAAPGALGALRVDGTALRWRRGDEERSAPAP